MDVKGCERRHETQEMNVSLKKQRKEKLKQGWNCAQYHKKQVFTWCGTCSSVHFSGWLTNEIIKIQTFHIGKQSVKRKAYLLLFQAVDKKQ